jgi:cephalosporin hydroxylase
MISIIRKAASSLLFGTRFGRGIVTDAFHSLYYRSKMWSQNRFLGFPIYQCPFDLQLYHEVVFDLKPRLIIQTGVAQGGSILYFATLLDLISSPPDALVIGVDIQLTENAKKLSHPRVHLIEGSSTDPEVLERVKRKVQDRKGLVILDSDHSKVHVLKEMNLYRDLVEVGSYLVAEDTNINGHPVEQAFGPGPLEAVHDFLKSDDRFRSDEQLWERNQFSFHQHGWLKRIRE